MENLRWLFVALQALGGQVGMPILILTYFLSKNVKRHPVLVNFWITWMIYSVSYCLLQVFVLKIAIYSGYHHEKRSGHQFHPSMLCRVQSAMVHGAPPMSVVATLIVVLYTWKAFEDPIAQAKTTSCTRRPSAQTILSLGLPYLIFLLFALVSAIVGNHYPRKMNGNNGLYCTLDLPAIGRYGVPIFCTTMLVLLVSVEVVLSVRFYMSWRRVSKLCPLAGHTISPSLLFRILLFNLYSIAPLSSGIVYISNPGPASAWSCMLQAAMPSVAFIVFGSQKDMIRAWFCWRSKDSDSHWNIDGQGE